MKPVLIVKAGTTVAGVRARRGDFEDWIAAGLGEDVPVRVAAVFEGAPLPATAEVAAVVVTGSSAMVSAREAWSEAAAAWLARAVAARLPVLGICYGHQLLAHALGGRVGANPRGREIGSVDVHFDAAGDALLGAFGPRECFQATHVESVLRLPPGARCLAANRAEPHHAFALRDRVWGAQFHPEFDADVMRGYLDERRDVLAGEGIDAARLIAATRETPSGPRLLRRFARLVAGEFA